jgi:hypothetical protein
MKARNVSVSVVQMKDEQYVSVVFRLSGAPPLDKEAITSPQGVMVPDQFRVKESSRKQRQKYLQHIIETMEFDNDIQ